MGQAIKKIIIGLILGASITAIIGNDQVLPAGCIVLTYLWGIGTAYAFGHHLTVLLKMLNPGLKLSIISFLTFRNGFMGSVPILLYVTYCLMLGWIHGISLLMIDIIRKFV